MKCARVMAAAMLALASSPAAAMDICGSGKRHTCVVDGDTVWIAGEKIRLLDIDAPETDGACDAERMLSAQATRRLAELLETDAARIERDGLDRFGRTLAILRIGGVSAGGQLVEEGLARPWSGRRESWC